MEDSAAELEGILARLVQTARETTGARYAALAILDRERLEIEHFVTAGLDARTREAIGAHPRGRGVLGQLILDPRPLRLDDVSADPRSYGFPPDHPEMHGFLGVPVLIDGTPWGNLYVADPLEGPFGEAEEHVATALALAAATAVERARPRAGEDPRR